MTRTVLLDANMIIGAFDGEPGNAAREKAKQAVASLLQDDGVAVAITPLIRYEVLRGVSRVDLETMNQRLNDIHEFDVSGKEARRAAEIFRLAKANTVPIDKRSFDVFHYVAAELNGLELVSQDGDIAAIRTLLEQAK